MNRTQFLELLEKELYNFEVSRVIRFPNEEHPLEDWLLLLSRVIKENNKS